MEVVVFEATDGRRDRQTDGITHDTLLGGHRGVAKTQFRVTSEFYWPGIHDEIGDLSLIHI